MARGQHRVVDALLVAAELPLEHGGMCCMCLLLGNFFAAFSCVFGLRCIVSSGWIVPHSIYLFTAKKVEILLFCFFLFFLRHDL